jgi:hypothetical protein
MALDGRLALRRRDRSILAKGPACQGWLETSFIVTHIPVVGDTVTICLP